MRRVPDAVLLRRNWMLLAGAVLPVLAGPWLVRRALGMPVPEPWLLVAGAVMSLCGLVWFLYVLRANPMQRETRGELVAGEPGVSFDGARLAERRDLTAGYVVAASGKVRLRLERRWPRPAIELLVDDNDRGRSVLQALGLDASQVVASFLCASPARSMPLSSLVTWVSVGVALFGPMFAVGLLGGGLGPLVAMLCGLGVCALWQMLCSIPMRVVVGADGIASSWLGRKRFIRYEQVRSARPLAGAVRGVALMRADGRMVHLGIRGGLTVELADRRAAILLHRIIQARHDQRGRKGPNTTLPARGDRTLEQWIRALRAAGSGGDADHRSQPLLADDLWSMVEDAALEPEARAGAAIALGPSLDPEGRSRLRIAAEATASPDIRALLELAAEGADEEQLEPALRRVRRT